MEPEAAAEREAEQWGWAGTSWYYDRRWAEPGPVDEGMIRDDVVAKLKENEKLNWGFITQRIKAP